MSYLPKNIFFPYNKEMSFQADYAYGLQQQTALLPLLKKYFNDEITTTPKKYDKYDYEGVTTSYELKSRKVKYDTYPTTCIAIDKIDPFHTKKQVYLFNFLDGTYYIEYDKELFDTFEVKEFRRWRTGFNDKEKPYMYIPIEKLTLMVDGI
jgi:hypothetical protein